MMILSSAVGFPCQKKLLWSVSVSWLYGGAPHISRRLMKGLLSSVCTQLRPSLSRPWCVVILLFISSVAFSGAECFIIRGSDAFSPNIWWSEWKSGHIKWMEPMFAVFSLFYSRVAFSRPSSLWMLHTCLKFLVIDGIAALISVPTQIYLLAHYGEPILTKLRQFKLVFLWFLQSWLYMSLFARFANAWRPPRRPKIS